MFKYTKMDRAMKERYFIFPEVLPPLTNFKLSSSIRRNQIIHDGFYEKNIIFTHIPKAAGSSIGISILGHDRVGHYPLSYLREIDLNFFYNSLKFCISRDPYTRVVSAFNYLKKGGKGKWDEKILIKHKLNEITFEEFVLEIINDEIIYSIIHLTPQYEFITDNDGNILTDHIIKMENLEFEIEVINKHLGEKIKLEKHNKSGAERPKDNDSVKDKIREIYQKDYEIFGY
ncbi:MAG: sulfotransferase family 2 domain-containing protein [Hellea sp.]